MDETGDQIRLSPPRDDAADGRVIPGGGISRVVGINDFVLQTLVAVIEI